MAWIFDPPGGLQDFSDLAVWRKFMHDQADGIFLDLASAALGKPVDELTDDDLGKIGPELAYVHPLLEQVPAGAETVGVVPWKGFPRLVDRQAPWPDLPPVDGDFDGSHRAVEDRGEEDHAPGRFVDRDGNELKLPVRHRQDEYLEWASTRDSNGKLSKITFVAEGYDYFETLFLKDEGRVVEIFEHFTGVRGINADQLRAPKGIWREYARGGRAEVVAPGGFNPRNRLNIEPGIVHLSHRANSLGAEINLAGVSALSRKKVDGSLIGGDDEEELLCCNQGGEPNRNSDPKISQQAYNLVQQGYRYTLANPIGLYIAGVDEASLTLPDGSRLPREWWNVVRGHDLWSDGGSRVLRLEITPPSGERATLEDLQVDGAALRFPGQLARLIGVHLFVTRWKRASQGVGPVVPCRGTCCRVEGTQVLVRADGGACGDGTELAFPGLVTPAERAAPRQHKLHGVR